MDDQKKLMMSMTFDRSNISRMGGIRHLVVNIVAPELAFEKTDEIYPLNLGVVIDASSSMASSVYGRRPDRISNRFDTCLEAAKAAAIGVVENLGNKDRLSVVSFSDDATIHVSGLNLDEPGKSQAMGEISRIYTRGCTNLHDGWLKGAEHVAVQMDENDAYKNRVVILSDGHANRGIVKPEVLGDIAAGLRERGITSSTVGIGGDYSTDQLEQIAVQGGGMLHHAQKPEEIVEVLMGELGSIRNTFAENLVLECTLSHNGNVLDGRVLGLPFHKEGNGLRCPVGFLRCGQSRQVVIRVNIPELVSDDVINIQINLRWKEVACEGDQKSLRETASLKVVEQAVENLDIELGKIVAKMWLGEIIRRAMVMNRDGDYEGVEAFLKIEIADFKAYCEFLPEGEELIKKVERTRRSVRRPMQEHARKEVGTALFKMMRCSPDTRSQVNESSWEDYLEK